MKSTYLIPSLLAALILALANGCSFNHSQISVQPSALSGGQVLPHRAALVISPEFKNYKHQVHLVGETDTYPIGSALEDYARGVAGKCFRQVDVVSSEPDAVAAASDDLILIPRVVKSDSSFGKRKFNLTLVVEWTAKDRATQNTVWLKTITATGVEPAGSAFTGYKHLRLLFQRVFDDLSPKTYEAFQAASELK